ncbi:uncharacterized protein LOC116297142 [Actinia tenebrosa]|uniref:Uncharacterized protein LOC116297142 n=1 Tax=Actinia tenebrosa TaxID=6105 RepID=A0A6P8I937_ACTTE|nr:uncharacterized protein LOC116297142 [Actinia tenebrosa]
MQNQRYRTIVCVLVAAVIIIGIGCLITGIVMMTQAPKKIEESPPTTTWGYSTEGKRIGLENVLQKIQDKYFELYPNRISYKPGVNTAEVKSKYKPFDPSPLLIKHRTDSARKLLKELNELQVSTDKLKQFEKRAIAQAKYWVYHVLPYGVPYGYDYYNGDWMMGPDIFCWAPMCHTTYEVQRSMKHFKPSSVKDMELLKEKLINIGQGYKQVTENLRLGIAAGMVRNVEACQSGLRAITSRFRQIHVSGERGILNSSFVEEMLSQDFLSDFNTKTEEVNQWKTKYGKEASQSIEDFLVKYVGEPIYQHLRYLETNYSMHCVLSSISSGFGSLPLQHVYVNNTPVSKATGLLPNGEQLNGTETYYKLLSYFTTINITANEIQALGTQLVDSLYGELMNLTRKITGESDNDRAKASMKAKLNEQSNYFANQNIPANESNEDAYKRCISMETAKVHCPVRWYAMQRWFSYVRELTTILSVKVMKLFHVVGPKISVPSCPVEPKADFNPASPAPTYRKTNTACTNPAGYYIPFFLKKPGPKSDEGTISAHEVSPGHHLQVQGYVEHFSVEDKGVVRWLSSSLHFLAFSEGWALYSEDPLIARETDSYKDFPLMKFGALKWQLVRAARLVVETALHTNQMSRDEAVQMLSKYMWEDTGMQAKEVTRYQSVPGQAVSYMIGRIQILNIRQSAQKRLGNKFNIKDFHFHMLRQGASPLSYLETAMHKYVSCVLNSKEEGCEGVLKPPIKHASSLDGDDSDVESLYHPSFVVL